MSQRSLDEIYRGEAPHVETDTSIEAAGSIGFSQRTKLQMRVLEAIRQQARTDEELQRDLGMAANTERPRRRELALLGLIEDTGKRRRTRSGRHAIVWGERR